ncbi:type II toxin-antitoxin system RelE/ParE family toxin [Gramella sp. AN32]|uniref:Type II toxin-antitoxin system RelE/ParE family toxin n=1 Tax=Christiangramia antarctica TaxID=2058158 RepID=A0ABW5X8H8_9FLAO|nr:type II toxin-antitoxin system RelE/ParE family toxin [Gramella sp. AN32]MCM4156004.1 type II toxin-antitoxin system RelE/ParE family toxin [Gramella sp. AN32]
MGLEIYWTRFAEDELYRIFKYYLKKVGYQTAKKLAVGIYEEPFKLTHQPKIGQIEEYLKNRKVEFRYLLYKRNYKIIYWINQKENRIEINDVFDVRQYPPKLKRTQ